MPVMTYQQIKKLQHKQLLVVEEMQVANIQMDNWVGIINKEAAIGYAAVGSG
jgi:hypothetical protein